ncbi:serine/threonine protein kinase, partial [Candidatus Poribacteria bacterium]|nr:serine/threonine protein kinase [Candidatus Poribacteria bacterium]
MTSDPRDPSTRRPPPDAPRDPSETYNPQHHHAHGPISTEEEARMLTRWVLESAEDIEVARHAEPTASAYMLRRIVARGGMGEIWEAMQASMGRVVAIKRIREDVYGEAASEGPGSERFVELSFRQEALTTGLLEHPNIVPVYDLGLDEDGRPLIAMKLVRGVSWDQLLTADMRKPMSEILARHLPILLNVSQAVAFAHSRGVIHRDLKPSQVMLGEFGEVLLMDWGIAVRRPPDGPPAHHEEQAASEMKPISTASNPAGTAAYMAPEQTDEDCDRIGPWTDVFLLGGLLYQVLTGTPPHLGEDYTRAFFLASRGDVQPPEERAPDREIPPELSLLCSRAMRPEIGERMQGARDFIAAVQDYLSGATRIAESNRLTDEAASRLSRAPRGYEVLAECDNLLRRALESWKDNTRAREFHEDVLLEYIEAARAQGDLGLARVQASRLEDGPARQAQLERIAEAEARARRDVTMRRVAVGLCGVLAGIVLVLTVMSRANTHRRELADLRAAAETERAELFGELNALRQGEAVLAEEFTRELPLPSSLLEGRGTPEEPVGISGTRGAELLARRKSLHRERERLETLVPDLEREPYALVIGEANLRLSQARDTKDCLGAYDVYSRAAHERGDLPQPQAGMGIAAARAGYPTSATMHLEQAVSLSEEVNGPDHSQILALAGEAYQNLDDSVEAYKTYYRRSVGVLEPEWTALSLKLADQYRRLGEFAQSNQIAKPVADVLSASGKNIEMRVEAASTVAQNMASLGELDDSLKYQETVIGLYQQLPEPPREEIAAAMGAAGSVLGEQGDYKGAEARMRDAIAFLGDDPAEHFAERMDLLNSLGVTLFRQERYGETLKVFEEVLAARLDRQGANHPDVAVARSNLASCLMRLDRPEDAERESAEALRIKREVLGENHPGTIAAYGNFGAMLQRR